jgi:hypothetical protein
VRRGGKVYLVGQTGDLGSRCGGLDPHPAIFSDLLTSRSRSQRWDSRGRVTVRIYTPRVSCIDRAYLFSRSIDIDTLAIDRGMSVRCEVLFFFGANSIALVDRASIDMALGITYFGLGTYGEYEHARRLCRSRRVDYTSPVPVLR